MNIIIVNSIIELKKLKDKNSDMYIKIMKSYFLYQY